MLSPWAASARAEDVSVLVSGKEAGQVYLYKVGDQRYLDAKGAMAAYEGRFTWASVSDRVQLSVRGRQAVLQVGSKRARVENAAFDLPAEVMVRAGAVLVPFEFFASPAFSALAEADAELGSDYFEIKPRSSVRGLRWFRYKDHTRLALDLEPRLGYTLSRRGLAALEVAIPYGRADQEKAEELKDGIVERVRLRQDARQAVLSIELAEGVAAEAAWDAQLLGNPRRLVLDVYRDREALAAARAKSPRASPAPPERVDGGPPAVAGRVTAPPVEAEDISTSAAAAGTRDQKANDSEPSRPRAAKPRIVIDPGHGGNDYGATGRRGTKEKDINLVVAKELAKRFKASGVFDVLLTRSEDKFVPLAERSRLANDFGADLFMSLHCNANNHRSERGFEIYFLSERASDPEAERVAEMENASLALEEPGAPDADAEAAVLLHAMAKTEFINDGSIAAGVLSRALSRRAAVADRGVKQAAFYVLRGTNAPAVLVEMAFVSNAAEEKELGSKGFRSRIVDGLYAGILDYGKRQRWAMKK